MYNSIPLLCVLCNLRKWDFVGLVENSIIFFGGIYWSNVFWRDTERILEKLLKMGLLSSVEFLAKERRKGYIKRAFIHISVT